MDDCESLGTKVLTIRFPCDTPIGSVMSKELMLQSLELYHRDRNINSMDVTDPIGLSHANRIVKTLVPKLSHSTPPLSERVQIL